MEQKTIRFGSRDSALAVAQTRLIMDQIAAAHPSYTLELVTMKTTGDIILDQALDRIGGKGLFVKELDRALRDGRVDFTIHSLKDVPSDTPEDLPLVAYFKRGDPRDALIPPSGCKEPDFTKPIGCAGARRTLQLKAQFPNVETKLIRGNVLTRLAKLDAGEYGSLVLACAGLERLGLRARVGHVFTPEEILPAAGQGILVLQTRKGTDLDIIQCVDDPDARCAALAERAFVRTLDGGCSSPIAAFAHLEHGVMHLDGLYCEEGAQSYVTGSVSGIPEEAEKLGIKLAERLRLEAGL